MGKKGKGNKLAKMSEEERARYLQMRADIEEEARRRKMQLISMYMKNKLKREEAFCRLNMAKINQDWRTILRQVKCQELRREIIEMEKYCKEMMNHKDNVIKRLFHDLDVAHDQQDNSAQAHMEMVQYFIDIQKQRWDFYDDNYNSEKQLMIQQFNNDHEKLLNLSTAARENLESVYYQLDEKNESERKETYEKYLCKLDDIKAEMELRIDEITQKGEQKLEKLWREYQQALSAYVAHTEAFHADYMDLKERDEEYTNQTREYCYEIEKASNQLASLKLNLADAEEKGEIRLKHLKMLKEQLANKFNELKHQVDMEMQDNEERFKLVSVESYKAVKFFKALYDKGNTILQLAGVCRKFETEKEKILPLGLPPLTRVMFENEVQTEQQTPDNGRKDGFCNWLLMENFWKRVNNVKIDVVCLTQRKKSLEKENSRLKAALRERLINLNISHGINNHVNDYLAKRPSSMHVDRVKHIDLDTRKQCQSADVAAKRSRTLRPFSYKIEANFTNAVRSKMLAKGKPKFAKIEAIKH